MRGSLLESTENTRDLGGYPVRGGGITRRFAVLRSDEVLHPTPGDLLFLREHSVTDLFDLRGEADAEAAPSPFSDPSFSALAGIHYHHTPIDDGFDTPRTRNQVPDVYMQFTEGANMPVLFRQIAASGGCVLVHCSAGKDRTGVTAAILLLLAGVEEESIMEDHMRTRYCLKERFVRFHREHPDFDMDVVLPHPEYMEGFLARFARKYGTAEEYLAGRGLADAEIAALRAKLADRNICR